jgi:hypothetical protein
MIKHYTMGFQILAWAWSYQQKFSDLRNFQKKSENFKPTIFCQNVLKNYLANVLAWLTY